MGNVRFPHDLLFLGNSLETLQAMLGDAVDVAGAVGLELHIGEAKAPIDSVARHADGREAIALN